MAWPTVITMVSYTVMQFIDSIMVAQLGTMELAAQGNGGVWTWTVTAFLVGIISLVNTFASQAIGAGDSQSAARYTWAGIWFGLASWVVVLLPFGLVVLPWAFELMGHEQRLVQLETGYAKWIVIGGCFTLLNRAIINFYFAIARPKVVACATIVGNLANIGFNYALIYGEAGLPALGLPGIPGAPAWGVEGAAIATVIGTAIECAIPAVIFLGPSMARAYSTRLHWRLDIGAVKDLVRVGWPASLQFGNEMLCWSIFMTILVGTFGTNHLAAGWIVLRYMHLSFMPAVAFSIATTTLVGRAIGAGKPELAERYARTAVWMSVLYMGSWGAIMMFGRNSLIEVFTDAAVTDSSTTAAVIEIGAKIMIVAAIFQAVDAIGIVYTGALRGAGDTLWPGVVTFVLSWSCIIGGGWIMVRWWTELESIGPWIGAGLYIFALSGAMAWRFERGPWRTNPLIRHAGQVAVH